MSCVSIANNWSFCLIKAFFSYYFLNEAIHIWQIFLIPKWFSMFLNKHKKFRDDDDDEKWFSFLLPARSGLWISIHILFCLLKIASFETKRMHIVKAQTTKTLNFKKLLVSSVDLQMAFVRRRTFITQRHATYSSTVQLNYSKLDMLLLSHSFRFISI